LNVSGVTRLNALYANTFFCPLKFFKIDHPLDPVQKYLYHSSVESSDSKNIYDGVIILDSNGEAVVALPEWFEALNRDFSLSAHVHR
jgi:hypothetical protein